MTEEEEFLKLLEESEAEQGSFREFKPGEKVETKVVAITGNSILVDYGAKSEGIIDRGQFEKDGELTIKEGDKLEAYFLYENEGESVLSTKLNQQDANYEELQTAHENGMPIEIKVTGKNKAGLEISAGGLRGFCPASQVSQRHVEDLAVFVGQTLKVKILDLGPYNLVVSARKLQQEEQQGQIEELKQTLSAGQNITGYVTRLVDFGAFVDLGGVDGLIPMGELSWERVKNSSDLLKEGDQVTVKILNLDWDKNRIALSLKQAGSDPWNDIQTKFKVGTPYQGKITRVLQFGAIVQLESGIEGLLHISKLGAGKRLQHASEVLEEDQSIHVYVDTIDLDQRRISLSLENEQAGRKIQDDQQVLIIGGEHEGTIDDVKPYGIFIKLSEQRTGLLHISQTPFDGSPTAATTLKNAYKQGEKIKVVIDSIHNNKISLSLPESDDQKEIQESLKNQKQASGSFGSLGGVFDNLSL
ncbi:MAG: S1 RNA-binding domain-containing protein [Lentisphaeria bacterium]|nr:S1 RNA-binding domain-containing protein [Lentisphaeria bacterium]